LRGRQATTNDLRRHAREPLSVVRATFVESERLLLEVAAQMERLHGHVVPFRARFNRLQLFSISLVWTLPLTYV